MPYYSTVTSILEKKLVIPTTGWTALRYGSTNAKSRKYIGVFNRSPYMIYITTDNNDTVGSSLVKNPAHVRVIRQGGERIFPYSDKVTLYARSTTGGATVIVTEECG
jgi:hypothetical protein